MPESVFKTNKVIFNNSPKRKFPQKVEPMKATLIHQPFDDKDWVFEIKWDGYRAVAFKNKKNVDLISRNQNSFNHQFPVIVDELKKIEHDFVIDGEMVVVDKNGVSHFQLIQNFQKTGEGNIQYYAFDLLWCDGYELKSMELVERKKLLEKIINGKSNLIKYSEHIEKDGKKFFKIGAKNGLEGIVAKKANSEYNEGVRSVNWLKIKTEKRQEAIICGFTEPKGSRKYFGSVLLGVYDKKELKYIGHAGTGFDERTLKDLYNLFDKYKLDKSPFKIFPERADHITWLKPKLLCEVKFTEWTSDNLMRQPVFRGLRNDKAPKEVVKEV